MANIQLAKLDSMKDFRICSLQTLVSNKNYYLSSVQTLSIKKGGFGRSYIALL